MSTAYLVEPLSAAKHRRNEFTCESVELTEFLRTRARKEMEARASACFVLVLADDPGRIAGYYTLSAAEVVTAELPEAMTRKLPRYHSLPATLLGRLARDLAFRGQGIGELLLMHALSTVAEVTERMATTAVVVDAKDEAAKAFYMKYEFVPFPLNPMRLYLSTKTIRRLIG